MEKRFLIHLLLVSTILLSACKENPKKETVTPIKSSVKYAKGFDIINVNEETKKLIIKNPYLNANESFEYILSKNKQKDAIHIPIEKLVVTSTTHIPMLEVLNGEELLVGFPNTKYISSKKTRALISNGKIKELGIEADLNTEVLLDLQPDAVVAFSMNKTNKSLQFIEKNGIPVVLNGDWLEETPLGRAEWIKLFGVLLNKEKEADSIFNVIEKNYLEAKHLALKATSKPSILSGAFMQKDVWNLPAGESFVAQFLEDANTNYLWKDTKGKGSLSLSLESVLDKAQNADYWVAPGYFNTKEEMLQKNKIYSDFTAFKENKLYTPNMKKGSTGGVIYFELGPSRPDLVLKDIIKITHPELLEDYEFTFFEVMK